MPRVGLRTHVRNHKKYLDLIGVGGNTDVCPGWQTPSRRHWNELYLLLSCKRMKEII